jgi:hypothetical protein
VARRRPDERSLVPIVDRMVDQRFAMAVEAVSRLRAEDPNATPDELADRLIRKCAKELAVGGAVAGGAAASPVAGVAVAAATAGADATYSMGRLSEMIMGIGLIYGHEQATVDERTALVLAVLGLSESAAVGLTGLAARVGSRGGARLVARLPSGAAPSPTAGATKKAIAKLSNAKGPWSLAALVPYGIGAGVGAAGNAVLARSVGRAAKQYFAGSVSTPPPQHATVQEDAGEGEVVEDPARSATASGTGGPRPGAGAWDDEIVDAVIVETVDVHATFRSSPPPAAPSSG